MKRREHIAEPERRPGWTPTLESRALSNNNRTGLLTREEAEPLLEPLRDDIARALHLSLVELHKLSQSSDIYAAACGSDFRVQGSILNKYIHHFLLDMWSQLGAREVSGENDCWCMVCGFLLKPKKLNKMGEIQGIMTTRTKQVYGQEELPGMPPCAPRLLLGYQTDEYMQSITSAEICLPNSQHRKIWCYPLSLYGEMDATQTDILDTSLVPAAPAQSQPRRWAVREDKRPKTDESGEGDA